MNKEDFIQDLQAMRVYFLTCLATAGNYAAEKKFTGYIRTLDTATDMLLEKIPPCACREKNQRGAWRRISAARIYECSLCGQNVLTDDIDVYKYCHGCGARMEEPDEDPPERRDVIRAGR